MSKCLRTGKVTYATRQQALNARKRIKERTKRKGSKRRVWERNPYLCAECGGWHLTSTEPA